MDRIWYDPKIWVAEILTAAQLNREIRDNLAFIRGKNRGAITERDGVDTTSTTPIGDLILTTHGNDVKITASFQAGNVAGGIGWFDVEMDLEGGSTIYASTLTSTPATRGLYPSQYTQERSITFSVVVTDIPAGTHTFRVISGGVAINVFKVGRVAQFMVEEYGKENELTFNPLLRWLNGMNLTSSRLNAQLQNNMNRLFKRKYTVTRIEGTSFSTSSVTFIPLDGTKHSFYSTGRDLILSLLYNHSHTGANGSLVYVDVLIDGTTWLSSMTDTALSDGWNNVNNTANVYDTAYIEAIIRLDEGWHTFELYYKSSTATGAAFIATNLSPLIFTIEEDGIRT